MNLPNLKVKKRDGRIVQFDYHRIINAVHSAYASTYPDKEDTLSEQVASSVLDYANPLSNMTDGSIVDIEYIQDLVEQVLSAADFNVARNYISYRDLRTRARNANNVINKTISDLIYVDSKDNDDKRENANIDGDSTIN